MFVQRVYHDCICASYNRVEWSCHHLRLDENENGVSIDEIVQQFLANHIIGMSQVNYEHNNTHVYPSDNNNDGGGVDASLNFQHEASSSLLLISLWMKILELELFVVLGPCFLSRIHLLDGHSAKAGCRSFLLLVPKDELKLTLSNHISRCHQGVRHGPTLLIFYLTLKLRQ